MNDNSTHTYNPLVGPVYTIYQVENPSTPAQTDDHNKFQYTALWSCAMSCVYQISKTARRIDTGI